jgi:hypothetical protein
LSVAFLQAIQVAARIPEAVNVIDAQAGHITARKQFEDELVSGFENFRNLDTDCGQMVNIEKAPVIYFFGGGAPIAEPVDLLVQQFVQCVKARGIAGLAFNRPKD